MRTLLSILSQAPSESAFSIAAAIPDMGRTKELLLALGDRYLEEGEDAKELTEICDYLVICGRYRNSIVHGQWGLTNNRDKVVARGIVHEFMWIRIYTMIDKKKEFHAALGEDPKTANQYVFTVPRLEERTSKVIAFADRIEAFSERVKGRIRKPQGSA